MFLLAGLKLSLCVCCNVVVFCLCCVVWWFSLTGLSPLLRTSLSDPTVMRNVQLGIRQLTAVISLEVVQYLSARFCYKTA